MKTALIHQPLVRRRDGKKVLLEFVQQFLIYKEDPDPNATTEWHLRTVNAHFAPYNCRHCRDTGWHGAGPFAPLTGMECHNCGKAAELAKRAKYVADLEERVAMLERVIATHAIEVLDKP